MRKFGPISTNLDQISTHFVAWIGRPRSAQIADVAPRLAKVRPNAVESHCLDRLRKHWRRRIRAREIIKHHRVSVLWSVSAKPCCIELIRTMIARASGKNRRSDAQPRQPAPLTGSARAVNAMNAFDALDRNHDGMLSREEFAQARIARAFATLGVSAPGLICTRHLDLASQMRPGASKLKTSFAEAMVSGDPPVVGTCA